MTKRSSEMSSRTDWLDHVKFMVNNPYRSEFTDPLGKTYEHTVLYANKTKPRAFAPEWLQEHSIPTIIIDNYSAKDFDPSSEITLALEMMFRQLFNDSIDVTFGEPNYLSPVAATE
jgi:hypothetical protein